MMVGRRVLRHSGAWFTDGSRWKAEARRSRRCVECRRALVDGRSPYCSRRCQWSFRGRFFWDAARTFVLYRDRYTCQICFRRLRVRHLEVDHVVELARGGAPLDYLNLQTVCRPCHRAKTAGFLRGPRTERPVRSPVPQPPGPLTDDADWGATWFPS